MMGRNGAWSVHCCISEVFIKHIPWRGICNHFNYDLIMASYFHHMWVILDSSFLHKPFQQSHPGIWPKPWSEPWISLKMNGEVSYSMNLFWMVCWSHNFWYKKGVGVQAKEKENWKEISIYMYVGLIWRWLINIQKSCSKENMENLIDNHRFVWNQHSFFD